ncbi:MAG: hypothetical protein JST35_00485 [Armatimonadetes bacterium]|nr:hypothetical protein [Armatimonadota bacterium]
MDNLNLCIVCDQFEDHDPVIICLKLGIFQKVVCIERMSLMPVPAESERWVVALTDPDQEFFYITSTVFPAFILFYERSPESILPRESVIFDRFVYTSSDPKTIARLAKDIQEHFAN